MNPLQCVHRFQDIDSPISLVEYFRYIAQQEYAVLLDSGMDPCKLGRFSFAGWKPFLVFKSKGDRISIMHNGEMTYKQGNPFLELRNLLSRYRVDPACYGGRHIPFLGGAVGYFGYELCYHIEELPCHGVDDLGLPDCYFLFYDSILIYDHREKKLALSVIGFDVNGKVAEENARQKLEELHEEIRRIEHVETYEPPAAIQHAISNEGNEDRYANRNLDFRPMLTEEQYTDMVRKAGEHIAAGDVLEVCTTHRFECDFSGDAFELYQELRSINPAPFAAYLNLPEVKIVSSSPERFLQVGRDGWCMSRPIKGTRPRGATQQQDRRLYAELLSSAKDRAEHVMIVDLVRNDFGRVCEKNSIQVPELMIIEEYATVFQMVSTIVGKLEMGRDCLDLVQACFPGGSMTGAPKIKAMSIIDSLEPVKRGIYSGSIGYLDFAGSADLNIVIRTILVKDGQAYFQVGGAVVADSDPKDEYLETLHKARALIQALRNIRQRTAPAGRDAYGPIVKEHTGRPTRCL